MVVIRNGQACELDEPVVIGDETMPREGAVVVSGRRWLEEDAGLARRGNVGLRLAPDFDVELLEGKLDGVELIEIEFPRFSDGRGYSLARLLRERLLYPGELRAVGDVLPDQLRYMSRCGFDSFALKPGKRVDTALKALGHLSATYQPATDGARPHWRT